MIRGIERKCLEMIKQSAKEMHPREFLALLSVGNKKDVISEIVLAPQMLYGRRQATFNIYMIPFDRRIVGTVHSHPSETIGGGYAHLHEIWKGAHHNRISI